ncbi:MAG: hypothetical protein DRN15_04755 [Thermoprotei archaeon]|nr:MAG: hypothetical protein DRM97_04345 [Thermoprotei archaeon]RLF23882.1 MAG: hypothetical protein DRN15_04755 [Thermoprotei archaeon]
MRRLEINEKWRLPVGVGPAEHGVYKLGRLWLAATYRNAFWEVDPESGRVLREFIMPGQVPGAPWVERDGLYGVSQGGHVRRFSLKGEILWTVNLDLGEFIGEAITEAWKEYIAVQFKNGIAIIRKSDGRVAWIDKWSHEVMAGQEPTYDEEQELLWVCRPLHRENLVAYDKNGDKTCSLTLPSPPTTYACPQIWNDYVVVVCSRHVVVVRKDEGIILWTKDYGTTKYGDKVWDSLIGGPRTLTIDGKVIVWTANGRFRCLDIASGRPIWRLDLEALGYVSSSCDDPWGYAGGVAVDGVFIILGRNNLPMNSGTAYDINKNRLFIVDYEKGEIFMTTDDVYMMACCCKPIVAKGKVIIGSWFKDSKGSKYEGYYYCWEIKSPEGEPEDKDYEWMGGLHHGGYARGCLFGS